MFPCGYEQTIPVSPHLYTALQQISQNNSATNIWIDAICIDQASDSEKEQQVPKMDRIYSNARRVLIWLGKATSSRSPSQNTGLFIESAHLEEDSDLAMDALASLNSKLAGIFVPIGVSDAQFPRYGLPRSTARVWRCIGDLVSRPWFRRLWVLQEVVLAREIVVMCGSKRLAWDDLSLFWSHARRLRFEPLVKCSIIVNGSGYEGWTAIDGICGIRLYQSQGGVPFAQLLEAGRNKDASQAVDRIYGLLGLASQELRDNIQIDYSQASRREFWRCYLNAAKYLVSHDSSLMLLSLSTSTEHRDKLPSWCLNFNSRQPEKIHFGEKLGWNAGFLPWETRECHITTCLATNLINVPGFRVDVIKDVVGDDTADMEPFLNLLEDENKCSQVATRFLCWEEQCLKLSQASSHDTPTSVPELHWRTLIADLELVEGVRRSPTNLQGAIGYSNVMDMWRAVKGGFENFKAPSMSGMELLGNYSDSLDALQGRTFFNTVGGRVGRGPNNARSGDILCIFHSGRPLYVLRYEAKSEVAKFVGDAYVYGLMNLEKLPLDVRGKDEIFVIG